jgi:hypothetical protein
MGCLQGGVLGAKAEVQALHKPLALNVSGQEVESVGQLVGHEIEVTRLAGGKRARLEPLQQLGESRPWMGGGAS